MKRTGLLTIVPSLWLFIALSAYAYTLNGKVVGVADGDTIAVLDNLNRELVVRLAGIDAPEHNQAFGNESAGNLSRLISGKIVTLDCGGEQSYGRSVCKVLLQNGEDVDLPDRSSSYRGSSVWRS